MTKNLETDVGDSCQFCFPNHHTTYWKQISLFFSVVMTEDNNLLERRKTHKGT